MGGEAVRFQNLSKTDDPSSLGYYLHVLSRIGLVAYRNMRELVIGVPVCLALGGAVRWLRSASKFSPR